VAKDDWYVNTVTVARRRVVLAVHADTLFPIVAVGVPLAELRELPAWLAAEVVTALEDEGLPASQLGSLDTTHSLLVRTASKKVLGQLNRLAADVEWKVSYGGGWDQTTVSELNRALRRALRGRGGSYVVPLELAELLDRGPEALPGKEGLRGADPNVEVLQLEASIDEADPPITRTLEIPVTLTLEQLHHLLQLGFGWEDRHLYRFARGGDVWGDEGSELYLCELDLAEAEPEDPPGRPVRRTRVGALLTDLGDELRYLYDYGDHWQLTLTLTGRGEGPAGSAAITEGRGVAPPNDSGGIHIWNDERPPDTGEVIAGQVISVRRLQRRAR
jgi:hypothetical protein